MFKHNETLAQFNIWLEYNNENISHSLWTSSIEIYILDMLIMFHYVSILTAGESKDQLVTKKMMGQAITREKGSIDIHQVICTLHEETRNSTSFI